VRRHLTQLVRQQLPAGYDVERHFSPRYDPWDQRVCVVPDGDLFKAIGNGSVSVVTDVIDRFTARGVRLAGGAEIEADIVVTATGLQLNAPSNIAIAVDGQAVDWARTMAYKGAMFTGVPNLVQTFGYTNASWTLRADLIARYLCRLLAHMDRRGQRVAWVEHDPAVAERPFIDFTSGYVQRSVAALPRQGDRGPWQVHQNYLRDLMAVRFSPIADGVLRLGTRYAPQGALPAARPA
jgi:cation diffusion facilitator CzcD-associated flavoprotein CzcO